MKSLSQLHSMKKSLIGLVLTASLAAAGAGENLWFNSSFELGLPGWCEGIVKYPFPAQKNHPEVRQIITSPDAIHGGKYLKITTGNFYHDGSFLLTSPDAVLQKGKTYTVSFYAKAEKTVTLQFSIHSNHMESWTSASRFQSFKLTPKWERYHFTFRHEPKGIWLKPGYDRFFLVGFLPRKDNEVCFDALQLEEGPLSDYKPAAPVEYSAALPTAYLADNDRIQAKISAISYDGEKLVNSKINLTDTGRNKLLQTRELKMTLPAGKQVQQEVSFDRIPYGSFRVQADRSPSVSAADFVRVRSNNKTYQDGKFMIGIVTIGRIRFCNVDLPFGAYKRMYGDWFTDYKRSGGVILDMLAHHIDLKSALSKEPDSRTKGRMEQNARSHMKRVQKNHHHIQRFFDDPNIQYASMEAEKWIVA